MGLDGGTIASRSDLLRRASWRLAHQDSGNHRSTRGGQLGAADALATTGLERRDIRQEAEDAFSTCALSGDRFPSKPGPNTIVGCALGRLYLHDAVVEFLSRSGQFRPGMCNTADLEEACGHIQRLRDVYGVVLVPNPAHDAAALAVSEGVGSQRRPGQWICPVSDFSTNGSAAFVVLRPCGHVVRERIAAQLSAGAKRAEVSASSTSRAVPGAASAHRTDGISTIQGGVWECPVCMAPIEVTTKLFAEADAVEKVRAALKGEQEARRDRKERKRKYQQAASSSGAHAGSGSAPNG